MTMQSTTLPFQVAGANAANAQPQRANALPGAAADGGKAFGDTLSRELAQRQAAPQPQAAPAAAQNKPAAKPNGGDKPAPAQSQRTAQREPARQTQAAAPKDDAPAAKTAQAEAAEGSEEGKDAAAASAAAEAATTPVTDMLAFMASLAQPAAAQPVAAEGTDAALQAAFQQIKAQDGLAATMPAEGDALTQEASSGGITLPTGLERAPAELRTTQDAASQSAAQAKPEAGQFQAQLREATQQDAAATEAPAPSVTQLQAQAAKLEAVQPAAVPGDRIPARVGSQGWDNQVSQRIVYMVGKEQAATLTLNPPDLGPVQVVLNVSNDQASVQFSSNQLEVRQALENAIPRLREMMSESGIALGNATVDAGTPDQRQASQDGERRGNGGAGGLNGNGRDGGGDTAESAPRAARTVALGERGMVDTFA
ncbi:flagellar hook-length control protein FliK [Massilia sp. DD77]|uniref:flagellar hook-length control protein FliK n=1 Tax=Massilia sp. DD77 TaxID=3109349 RepID=UPI002FFDAE20